MYVIYKIPTARNYCVIIQLNYFVDLQFTLTLLQYVFTDQGYSYPKCNVSPFLRNTAAGHK